MTNQLTKLFSLVGAFCMVIVVSLILGSISPVSAATGIYEKIHFQGKVVNSDGTNVSDGNYDFTFVLYDAASGGTTLWTENRTGGNQVTVTDGIFSVDLGEVNDTLDSSVDFNTDNIYLGVNFNSDGEMSPRVQFTAVPYAFQAKEASGLSDGFDSVYDSDADYILDIDTVNGLEFENTSTGDFVVDLQSTGDFIVQDAGVTFVTFADTGDVGLGSGATSPNVRLEIADATDTEYIRLNDGTDTVGIFSIDGDPNGGVTGSAGSIAMNYSDGTVWVNTDDGTTWEQVMTGDGAFTSSGGFITKTTSTDQVRLTSAEAGDYGLRVDTSVANTTDLVQIDNTGNGVTTDGVAGLAVDFDAASGGTGETNAGIDVDVTASGDASDSIAGMLIRSVGTAAGNLFGLNIENLSGAGAGTEQAIKVGTGWDQGLQVDSPAQIGSTLDVTGTAVIGTGTNGFTFNPASGPNYTGTARPLKTIVLSPEYAGGTLTTFYGAGTDTSIQGIMTADVETSATNDQRTYYEWDTNRNTLQGYSVAIRVKLPKDFSAWQTGTALEIDYVTENTAPTDNVVDAYVYLSSDVTTAVASSTGNVVATGGTWETITFADTVLDDGVSTEWDAADEVAIIYLRMRSRSNNYARVGDIKLHYLSAF